MVNGELVAELIRAHYDGDEARFSVLARQAIASEELHGSAEVAQRLREVAAAPLKGTASGQPLL